MAYHPDAFTLHTASLNVVSDDPDEDPATMALNGAGVFSMDVIATNSGATLDINTQTAEMTYDEDGSGPIAQVVFPGSVAFNTVTWTFGDFTIGTFIASECLNFRVSVGRAEHSVEGFKDGNVVEVISDC